jgi:hypothetical protein
MKKIILVALCLIPGLMKAQQEQTAYVLPSIGNSFEIGYQSGNNTVGKSSVTITPETKNITKTYFNVHGTGKIDIKVRTRVVGSPKAVLTLGFGKIQKKITITNEDFATVDLGSFEINEPGYYSVDFISADAQVAIEDLFFSGIATTQGMTYCNDKEYFYWARRGPSCHLNYEAPGAKDVSYYYNEVKVGEGNDINGSYFMANGFGEGYFGMQVNSATERRILFSVWSPFHTDDPKSIPEDKKIVMLKKGKDVYTGEFGNEGAGGQSFLRYNWKAGNTYKFLLKGVPDGEGNTVYTAWFLAPEVGSWQLIASFKRPHTTTYLKRFHSFLENFNPNQGYLTREVEFKNQWVYDGDWKKVTSAKLTVDNTYRKKQRIDATGGKTKEGYFLKMGGFFSKVQAPLSVFTLDNQRPQPIVDFGKLP